MNTLSPSQGPKPFGMAMWVCFGMVVLLATQVALGSLALPAGLNSGESLTGWYVRSGQWRADARTLVAGVKFLLDLDSAPSRR